MFDRSEQGRPEERVVGDEQEAVPAGDLGDRVEVGDPQSRIGRRLHEQGPGLRPDRGLDGGEVRHVDRGHVDAAPREVLVEEDAGDDEQLVADDEVVPRPEVREQRGRDRGHPRGRHDAVLGAFERGDLLLEGPVRRVAGPRVEVRPGLPGQGPVDGVLLLGGGIEGERRRGVDRRLVGVGHGIRPLAGMDGPRREALTVRPFPHPSRLPHRRAGPASSRRRRGPSLGRRGRLPLVAGGAADGWNGRLGRHRPIGPRGTRRGLDPGRRAGLCRRLEGPLAGDPRRPVRVRRLADGARRPRRRGLAGRGDRRVRGGLPCVPAGPSGAGRVPDRRSAATSTTTTSRTSTTRTTTSRTRR